MRNTIFTTIDEQAKRCNQQKQPANTNTNTCIHIHMYVNDIEWTD